MLGAEVWGYSLTPPTQPALFDQLRLAERLHHAKGDVRDAAKLADALAAAQPDFVFHLAAQSLVRPSYTAPLETFATNIMGTAHLLAGLQTVGKPCVALIVTSDKCYENHEEGRSYSEGDALGGRDPYSASKAAAEIVTASWRNSFCAPEAVLAGRTPPVAIASVRAGNVIGGGDWARDRIVPDCIRALARNEPIRVRNPQAVRPWQHVLEPLGGYLLLATRLARALESRSPELPALCGAFNFGPAVPDHRTVGELVDEVMKHWPGRWEKTSDSAAVHEAGRLNLATGKAERLLGWRPRWSFADAVSQTVAWYRQPDASAEFTRGQIAEFMAKGSS